MLKTLFEQYGQVKSVKIIKDHATGEPRGFAFVDMPELAEAQVAISTLNEYLFEGKSLKVNKAREREAGSRPSRPNGNRSGFGRPMGYRGDDRSRSRF